MKRLLGLAAVLASCTTAHKEEVLVSVLFDSSMTAQQRSQTLAAVEMANTKNQVFSLDVVDTATTHVPARIGTDVRRPPNTILVRQGSYIAETTDSANASEAAQQWLGAEMRSALYISYQKAADRMATLILHEIAHKTTGHTCARTLMSGVLNFDYPLTRQGYAPVTLDALAAGRSRNCKPGDNRAGTGMLSLGNAAYFQQRPAAARAFFRAAYLRSHNASIRQEAAASYHYLRTHSTGHPR